jgi:hypothetical protein
MRDGAAFSLAAFSAYASSCGIDFLLGGLLREYPNAVFTAVGNWSAISIVTLAGAWWLTKRHRMIALPFAVLAGIAAIPGIAGVHRALNLGVSAVLAIQAWLILRISRGGYRMNASIKTVMVNEEPKQEAPQRRFRQPIGGCGGSGAAFPLGAILVVGIIAGFLWLLCWIWPALRHSVVFWVLAVLLYSPALLVAIRAVASWVRAARDGA